MILDYENEFTALGGDGPVTATAVGTKFIPNTAVRDVGAGEIVKAYARITQAFNNLTSLDIAIIGADDNTGTNAVVYVTRNFLLAQLTLNALLLVGMVLPGQTKKLFLGCKFTVNGAAPGTGKVTCGLIPDRDAGPQWANFL